METMKKHRLHILLPVILVLVSLAGSLLYLLLHTTSSAGGHVSLGQQYLNELDYSAAVLEFSNAITIDPTNKQARLGLAEAYAQTGNYSFAADVLNDVVSDNIHDPELTQALIDIYQDSGKDGAAIQLIVDLIHQTDDEQYYDQLQQALRALYDAPHSYAQGTDQTLCIVGDVLSRGSNTLGQLGTDQDLGDRAAVQADFRSAGFAPRAQSVYCAGRTSYVLDENRDLWASGENRWGQMGLAYGTTLPESGWVQLTDTGDIAAVAGSNGSLLVLRLDGTLWSAGAGSGQTLTRVDDFDSVIRVAVSGLWQYVLTGEGKLYGCHAWNKASGWQLFDTDVIDFDAYEDRSACMYSDGSISTTYGLTPPDNWVWTDNDHLRPDIALRRMAFNGAVLVLWDTDGQLYTLDSSGPPQPVQLSGPVANLYGENGNVVAVLQDGTLLLWENGATEHHLV